MLSYWGLGSASCHLQRTGNDNAEIESREGESELIQYFAVGEIESYNAGIDSHNEESDHI